MYVEEGNFYASRGPTTVPLTLISCNTVFSKSQNAHKAGTLCTITLVFSKNVRCIDESLPIWLSGCPIKGNFRIQKTKDLAEDPYVLFSVNPGLGFLQWPHFILTTRKKMRALSDLNNIL